MATEPKPHLTPQQYIDLERKADTRHEYWNGQTFAMAGTTRYHARIVRNLVTRLHTGLQSSDCQAYSSELRLHIPATGFYTYPNVMVACGEEQYLDDQFDTLLNPILLIEVLSESTADYDRGRKFAQYRSIASLREYLIVAQDKFSIEQYVRQEPGWTLTEYSDPARAIALVSLPLGMSVVDIYEKVNWPSP